MVQTVAIQFRYQIEMVLEFLDLARETVIKSISPPFRGADALRQIVFVAWESLPVILLSVSFAAAVSIIEASFHMKLVIQNDSLVPGFAAMLILRELGAVVSALLLTSRIGAGIAAEVGTMRVTEQIDALKMLGIDPVRYLVVPRFIACIFGGIVITVLANAVCLYCALVVSLMKLGYSTGGFLMAMRTFVDLKDLLFATIKGASFGAVIPVMSCFYGFRCQAGAEGVGQATTNSVVTTSVVIIVLDFLLTWVFSHFY